VILHNLGREPFQISPGERIAQMVIARYEAIEWEEANSRTPARAKEGSGRREDKKLSAVSSQPSA